MYSLFDVITDLHVKTDATTPNLVGRCCSGRCWMLLAGMLLWGWQWCCCGLQTDATTSQFRVQAGRASSQFWEQIPATGISSKVFPFSLVSVLVLLLLFLGCVIISCSISRSTSCSAFIMIGLDSNKNSTRARRVLWRTPLHLYGDHM